jgi:hypothetical protein
MYTETATRTTTQRSASSVRHVGAIKDAELLALGREFDPLFERWSRQVAFLRDGVSIPAREKAYKLHDRLHSQVGDLIDEILSYRASTPEGLALQVRAAMVDLSLDTLFFDPDPRLQPFFRSLCAFTGVQFPTTGR